MTPQEWKDVQHTAFALYGFQSGICPIGELYEWSLSWFEKLGKKPDIAEMNLGGKTNGKYKSFKRLDRKARQLAFEGATDFELIDFPDELKDNEFANFLGRDFAIVYTESKFAKSFTVQAPTAFFNAHKYEVMSLVQEATTMLHPRYGFGFRSLYRYYPDAYALGGTRNGAEDPSEAASIGFWSYIVDHELFDFFLRRVYPWNLLNESQLNLKINDTRLIDWIKADSTRGILSRFLDDLTLWRVPEESLAELRRVLLDAGIIMDSKRHFEDVCNHYKINSNAVAESIKSGKPLTVQTRVGISDAEMREHLSEIAKRNRRLLKVEEGKLREISPKPTEES